MELLFDLIGLLLLILSFLGVIVVALYLEGGF